MHRNNHEVYEHSWTQWNIQIPTLMKASVDIQTWVEVDEREAAYS